MRTLVLLVLGLLGIAGTFAGCKPQTVEGNPTRLITTIDDMTLIQTYGSELVALDSQTGERRWQYTLPQGPNPPYEYRADPLCPIFKTARGELWLRYPSNVVVLKAATGQVVWKKTWNNNWTWPAPHMRCPAITPDSGAVFYGQDGLSVLKTDHRGKTVWEFGLKEFGAAISPLTTVSRSGDILVRTKHWLISIGAAGKLNWTQKLDDLSDQ